MATKPIKFLELHYTMTQFLITRVSNVIVYQYKSTSVLAQVAVSDWLR